tara:strand:- start:461 stop:697 length:237 start_codon:yes stop_codon:yes gene_type:complete
MMSDKDPQRFVTHDLALAAYLLMRGLVLKSAQKSANKFEFVFEDPANEAQKLSFEFIGSDFAAYDGYIRSLRGLLYQK